MNRLMSRFYLTVVVICAFLASGIYGLSSGETSFLYLSGAFALAIVTVLILGRGQVA
jgi:hypothetical protein